MWKPDPARPEERELIVRGYVSGKRQMAVCCCLHCDTSGKADGVKLYSNEIACERAMAGWAIGCLNLRIMV